MSQVTYYASDLHVEFGIGDMRVPEGNICLLAGDIMTLGRNPYEGHNHHDSVIKRTKKFVRRLSENFDQVYYVFGNHEHYWGDVTRTHEKTQSFIEWEGASNIRVMENEWVDTGEFLLWGGTMWTDIYKGDPLLMHVVKYGLNDYHNVTNNGAELHPADTVEWNGSARQSIVEFLNETRKQDKPRVVMTHHAPFHQSIPERFKADDLNVAYCNYGLEYTDVLSHDFTWIHGHIHDANDYQVEGVRVLSNPRGYWGTRETRGFEFKRLTSDMLAPII